MITIDITKIERGFFGSGVEIDSCEFEGEWDHIYIRYATKTHALITKYKIKDKNGVILPSENWEIKNEWSKEWCLKMCREEKLNELLND